MSQNSKEIDSFKFLPRIIAAFYQAVEMEGERPIPWTPLTKPIADCTFGLVTSGGLYQRGVEPPFDVAREHQEPLWGDPSFRAIPADIKQEELGASHLHLNTADVLLDMNILLPINRFQELVSDGRIGGLAAAHYSFMGFQGFPPDTTAWQEEYGPQIAARFKAENVDCAFLTPA